MLSNGASRGREIRADIFMKNTTNGPRHKACVVVFAKVPGLGIAKSRIAATEGRERAEAIYRELLSVCADTVAAVPHYVAYTGADSPGELQTIFPHGAGFFAQGGQGLGPRLKHAFGYLAARGHRAICAIGADCPQLTKDDILNAFKEIENGTDIVLGPAEDGGYYLVCTRPGCFSIFDSSRFQTEKLFEDTMAIAGTKGYSTAVLGMRNDIDTIRDYRQWKKIIDTT